VAMAYAMARSSRHNTENKLSDRAEAQRSIYYRSMN
jgi:hypothetical protein